MAEVKDGLPSTDFSRMNRAYVEAVAENAAAGAGGGLPDITTADEGKVLTVEDGEAAWAEGGASDTGNVFVVSIKTIDFEHGTDGVYPITEFETSIDDIFAAVEAKKIINIQYATEDGSLETYQAVYCSTETQDAPEVGTVKNLEVEADSVTVGTDSGQVTETIVHISAVKVGEAAWNFSESSYQTANFSGLTPLT